LTNPRVSAFRTPESPAEVAAAVRHSRNGQKPLGELVGAHGPPSRNYGRHDLNPTQLLMTKLGMMNALQFVDDWFQHICPKNITQQLGILILPLGRNGG